VTTVGAALDAFGPAPRLAAVYRNSQAVLDDTRLKWLAMPLRLPYALSRNLEPGLWVPSDIKTTAEDHSFGAQLPNLGSAVGIVGKP
jgi:hypothetical protein